MDPPLVNQPKATTGDLGQTAKECGQVSPAYSRIDWLSKQINVDYIEQSGFSLYDHLSQIVECPPNEGRELFFACAPSGG